MVYLIHQASDIVFVIFDLGGFKKDTPPNDTTTKNLKVSNMRFISLSLTEYEYVRDSDISHIEAKFSSDVQLVIGSNGSGKSSMMRMLSPYPATRTMFGKGGHKSQQIEKDGVVYTLESDFSKPSSPHLFYEGDNLENLNIGRTTDAQKDLIVEHLGITPFVDDLIMNRYTFPKWSATKRKEFVMANNPDQIGFVLTHLKQISSKIRACKNNLARLQTRKILLEQDLLSPEVTQELIDEKVAIDSELGLFQKNLMDIEVGLRTISHQSHMSIDISGLRKTVRNCRYKLASLSHVSRDDYTRSQDRENLIGRIAGCDQKIQTIEEDIIRITDGLRDMEVRYLEIAPNDDLANIDLSISKLEDERNRLQVTQPPFEITHDELVTKYDEWNEVRDRLLLFTDCEVTLLNRNKRTHREQLLNNLSHRKSSIEMSLSDFRTRYESLSKRNSLSPSDIPDSPCAKDKCPLYNHFLGEYTTAEEQRQTLKNKIARLEHKEKRIHLLLNALTDYQKRSKPYYDEIRWLVSYAQSNPILHHILRQMDIMSALQHNSNSISRKLKDAYDHIDQWIRLKSVVSDLETAYTLKTRKLGSQNNDTINLVKGIENAKNSLYELRGVIYGVSNDRSVFRQQLTDINTFDNLKKTTLEIKGQYIKIANYLSDNHEKDKLAFLKKSIESVRSERFLRLSDIERTLRAQESLQSRYTEEVVYEITRIEKEMSDLEQMEKALIAIPKESTINFLNDIFEQANKIIESVWTIPLRIELLSDTDQLNYEFTVSGDNNSKREISDCSDGQNEIITLAINLALRINLGHLDLPIALDEAGRTMDDTHKEKLLYLLKQLLDDRIISQLFLVSHTAVIHEGFSDAETLVVREDNVFLPEIYNKHVKII
jgi:ABC-type Mn2+/Zn2+ transport system ATPase subunit